MLNWYDARQTCERSRGHIQLFNNKCDKNEMFTEDTLWHNTFIKERIIWNTSMIYLHLILFAVLHHNRIIKTCSVTMLI